SRPAASLLALEGRCDHSGRLHEKTLHTAPLARQAHNRPLQIVIKIATTAAQPATLWILSTNPKPDQTRPRNDATVRSADQRVIPWQLEGKARTVADWVDCPLR